MSDRSPHAAARTEHAHDLGSNADTLPPSLRFLAAGGETGREILARDWSGTPLGPIESWPVSLRALLATMLECPAAMFLAWGPELRSFFNDAYRPIFGDRLPHALGAPFPEIWADLWQDIGPMAEAALRGESVFNRDLPLTMRRHGVPEETWWTFSYSPVRDDEGRIAGMVCVTGETTAQVMAERRRRESDARLEMALSAGQGVGIWDWDVPADRVSSDARFARLYGVDPVRAESGVAIEEFFRGIHPEDRPDVQRAVGEAMRDGGSFAEEYRLVQPDGSVRWVAAQGRCTLGPDGTALRFPGVSFDITARKATESALAASEDRFRGITNSIDQMIWSTKADGYHDYFNDRWYAFTGVPYGSTDGEAWNGMFHPDDQDRAWGVWRNSLETGQPYRIEYRLRHHTGAYRWVLGRAQPVRDQQGTVTRWFGTCTDIQEIVDAREVLARSREELERLVEARTRERDRLWQTTNDLMGTAGLDGYLKTVNPAWERLLGWSEAQLLGRPFFDIIDKADHAETIEVVERLAAGEQVEGFVDHIYQKDGSLRTVMWTAVPEGELFHIIGRDITDQRAAEEQLRQAQKMEAVGQLTGGIAHDFNNLLTGIVGSLDLMQTRIRQGRTDTLEKYATAAMSSANRAAALTHRLLAFARRQPLEQKPVDANGLITGMEDMLRRTLGERVRLEIVTAGGLWPTLCDPHQLENAVLNLAINARDAMPDGGRLVIETCNTHLDRAYARLHPEVTPGQYVCICVTDTGSGMAPDVAARAFEPFFTTKPLGMGTGLGLSMIYGFARQSEGHAKIYSEHGQGTTVKLYLPRYRGDLNAVETHAALGEAPRAERGETVLVVEDEPVVRDLIVEVLRDLGYRALEAEDGPSGLKLLQSRKRIDLLITDVGLPGLNGRQLADQGRDGRPGLKVLFITGYAENAMFGTGALDPGMQMITKPFPVDALATRIREMIES